MSRQERELIFYTQLRGASINSFGRSDGPIALRRVLNCKALIVTECHVQSICALVVYNY